MPGGYRPGEGLKELQGLGRVTVGASGCRFETRAVTGEMDGDGHGMETARQD